MRPESETRRTPETSDRTHTGARVGAATTGAFVAIRTFTHTLEPAIIAAGLLLTLTVPALASTSSQLKTRIDPGGGWCPAGLTFGEGRPGLSSSVGGSFDSGALETSFRAPADGWVYVTLNAIGDIQLDNIIISDRGWTFLQTASDTCHRNSDPAFPRVLTPPFDVDGLPGEIRYFQPFDIASLDDLPGWDISTDVSLLLNDSATELVVSGSQADITRACTAVTADCPIGSGSLLMLSGSRIRFPVRLPTGIDLTMTSWWSADVGARLNVRVDDFASCPEHPEGLFIDHTSDLEVNIIGADIDAGIDPDFFDIIIDQSDTFGFVTIDSDVFDIPQIDNNDSPTWDNAATFSAHDLADPENVAIKIQLFDNDEFENAHVDINPDPADGAKDLDLMVDLCRMTVEGDLSGDLSGTLYGVGDLGAGDDRGVVRFEIKSPTGKPVSTDDLAITDLDFVQAVHRSRYAVTELRGVVMVTVANNFVTEIDTSVKVDVSGPDGFFLSRTFPVTIPADSSKTVYLFEDAPFLTVPGRAAAGPSILNINAHIDPDGIFTAGIPAGDCRLDNDEVAERQWKIVETDPLEVHWCKVGRQIEALDFVSDAKLDDLKDLSTTFMNGIYPTRVTARDCPVPMPITPTGSTLDFLFTLLEGIGIPAGSVYPFAMVWDMNAFAVLSGMNKILGVLPNASWYEQFEGWQNVRGNSLGEAAPHAAILLPEVKDDDGDRHIPITLAAHELSHTYGLSADSRLKDTTYCGVNLPLDVFGIGALICGAAGGLDEYTSNDPARATGNPSTGYWVEQTPADPRLAHLVNKKQCDRHCFMGSSPPGQLDDWNTRGRWIDLEDWEHLISRLKLHPDPATLYVSGIIDAAGTAHFGTFFTMPAGIPDRIPGSEGDYTLLFFSDTGALLQSVDFPVEFNGFEFEAARPPATFFGFTVPWDPNTARIEIVRQAGMTAPAASIGERLVSVSAPGAFITTTRGQCEGPVIGPGETLQLTWDAWDQDGDDLTFVVMASVDGGDHWFVLRGWLDDQQVEIPSATMPEGSYLLRVTAMDGVLRGDSNTFAVEFEGGPGFLFGSGFETGDLTEWNGVSP